MTDESVIEFFQPNPDADLESILDRCIIFTLIDVAAMDEEGKVSMFDLGVPVLKLLRANGYDVVKNAESV